MAFCRLKMAFYENSRKKGEIISGAGEQQLPAPAACRRNTGVRQKPAIGRRGRCSGIHVVEARDDQVPRAGAAPAWHLTA